MLYTPGLTFGELSGKAGHTVASKGPFGNWISVQGYRTVPITQYTQSARASFYAVQKLFGTLSPSDLDDWDTLGENIILTGRLGRNYSLTAASVFCQINRNLYTIGQSYVTSAPAIAYPDPVAGVIGTATAPPTGSFLLELDIDPTTVPADTYFVVYGQKPKNSQSNRATKRGWKVVAVLEPSDSGVVDITAGYLQRFHGWFPLNTIAIRVTPVSASGFQGESAFTFILSD
jgi:hypothetical protein